MGSDALRGRAQPFSAAVAFWRMTDGLPSCLLTEVYHNCWLPMSKRPVLWKAGLVGWDEALEGASAGDENVL